MKYFCQYPGCNALTSPPARGAWIEIIVHNPTGELKESPPARGAWIEILFTSHYSQAAVRRPPHGGRGLKYEGGYIAMEGREVAPRTGGVD